MIYFKGGGMNKSKKKFNLKNEYNKVIIPYIITGAVIILSSFFYYIFVYDSDYLDLKKKYIWLNKEIYHIINVNHELYENKKYNLSKEFICAVIQIESGNACKNKLSCMLKVKSKANAIGLMQVLYIHRSKNPEILEDPVVNINVGCGYLYACMLQAKGNKMEACRLYNAGLNNKRDRYRNWIYVAKILNSYNDFIINR